MFQSSKHGLCKKNEVKAVEYSHTDWVAVVQEKQAEIKRIENQMADKIRKLEMEHENIIESINADLESLKRTIPPSRVYCSGCLENVKFEDMVECVYCTGTKAFKGCHNCVCGRQRINGPWCRWISGPCCRIANRNSPFLAVVLYMLSPERSSKTCTQKWPGMDCSYLQSNSTSMTRSNSHLCKIKNHFHTLCRCVTTK